MKIKFYTNEFLNEFQSIQDFLIFVKKQELFNLNEENAMYEIHASTEEIKNQNLILFQKLDKFYIYQKIIEPLPIAVDIPFHAANNVQEPAQEIQKVQESENKLSELNVSSLCQKETISSVTSLTESDVPVPVHTANEEFQQEQDEEKISEDDESDKSDKSVVNSEIIKLENRTIRGFTWEDLKEYQTLFLKFLIKYVWIEEQFHPRCTIKNLNYKNQVFYYDTPSLCFEKYNEKTKFALHKCVLAYTVLSSLEKCPPEFLENCYLLHYVAKSFKKKLNEFMDVFIKETFTSSIEKCIQFYCKLLPLTIEEKMKPENLKQFIELENQKKKLDTLFEN